MQSITKILPPFHCGMKLDMSLLVLRTLQIVYIKACRLRTGFWFPDGIRSRVANRNSFVHLQLDEEVEVSGSDGEDEEEDAENEGETSEDELEAVEEDEVGVFSGVPFSHLLWVMQALLSIVEAAQLLAPAGCRGRLPFYCFLYVFFIPLMR